MVHWSLVLDNRSLVVFRILSSLLRRGIRFHEHLEVFNWGGLVHGLIVCLSPVVLLRASHVHRLVGNSGHFGLLRDCLVVRVLYVGDRGVLNFLVGYVNMLDVMGFRSLVVRFRRFVERLRCLVVRLWGLMMRLRCLVVRLWGLMMRLRCLVVRLWCLVVRLWCLVMRLWCLVVGYRRLVAGLWRLGMRLWCLRMRDRMMNRCVMGLEHHVGIMLHWKSLILQWNDNRSCIGMGCHSVHRCFVVSRRFMCHYMFRG